MVAEYRLAPSIVINSKTYSVESLVDQGITISRGSLGMGSTLTWYGSPDSRADWSPLQYIKRDLVENDSESESSSWGKTTTEAKLKLKRQHNIDQLVAQTVVSSHIHNRHPNQNPLIPALGISGKLVAIMYDCVKDMLFHVVALKSLDINERCFNPHAIFLLWLLLHHSLF